MNTNNKIFTCLVATFILILLISGCQNKNNIKQNVITVSILPQKYIVQQMLTDSVLINVMVTKGNSPASYSPSPEQLKLVSQSSLYLKIGHIGFEEAWLDRFVDINKQLKIVDTSDGIDYIMGDGFAHDDHNHEQGIEPHVWTSPKAMLTLIKNTKEALKAHFPGKTNQIETNCSNLVNRVTQLDSLYSAKLSSLTHKCFLIFHPAYTYLARDYNLTQISIEHQGKEPSSKWLKTILSVAKEKRIRAIFVQEEFDKRNAEIIAHELDIPIIEVHPLAENWEEEMRGLLEKLINAIG